MNTPPVRHIRPPLKWAGSKYRILHEVLNATGSGKRLLEPFAGSAVVALNAPFKRCLLNDINQDLIRFYAHLKDHGDTLIEEARNLFNPATNQPDAYYDYRELFNTTRDEMLKSALFLYLNKHGYNGLCRYNASGLLNVPFGRYKKPSLPEQQLLKMQQRLQSCELSSDNFQQVFKRARLGDVIYCDPPYAPLSNTANFTAYSAGGFNWEAQEALASSARATARRGIRVVISNHDLPAIRDIYAGAALRSFQVQRMISCASDQRKPVSELIAIFAD